MTAGTTKSRTSAVVLLGATAIAFAPIFAVLAGRAEPLAPTVTAFWRTALAFPVLGLLAATHRDRRKPVGRHMPWLLLPGAFFAVDLSCWHTAMGHISAGLATVLGNLSVVIVPAAAWLVFREHYERRFIPATLLALFGAALVCIVPDAGIRETLKTPGTNYVLGNSLASGTAFAYAGYQLSIKWARRFEGALPVMAWSSLGAAVLLLAYSGLTESVLIPTTIGAWFSLGALAFVSHCLGQGLIAWSLGKLEAHRVALLLLWQPACSAVLAVVVLGQAMSPLQWAGTLLVMTALAVANWPRRGGFSEHASTSVSMRANRAGETQ